MNLLASLLAPLLAPLARLAGYLAAAWAGWGIASARNRAAAAEQRADDAEAMLKVPPTRTDQIEDTFKRGEF